MEATTIFAWNEIRLIGCGSSNQFWKATGDRALRERDVIASGRPTS
jgi:hypothetical protein